jgi:hypothetical protein
MYILRGAPRRSSSIDLRRLSAGSVPTEPRRAHARFAVPGATVRIEGVDSRSEQPEAVFSEGFPVLELSLGGMSFLDLNQNLEFILILPEAGGSIRLGGRVAYCVTRRTGRDYCFRIGVQFADFGAGEGENTLEALAALEKLEESCKSSDALEGSEF